MTIESLINKMDKKPYSYSPLEQELAGELQAAQTRLERYEKALRFYAAKENWEKRPATSFTYYEAKCLHDKGKTAREALSDAEVRG